MHKVLLDQGLLCRRTDVRLLLKELDPDNVKLRRKRRLRHCKYINPDYYPTWHIETIRFRYPCLYWWIFQKIDMAWGCSNKLPEIIAKYYTIEIKKFGLPKCLKADDGTEHAIIEPMHITLRSLDGPDALDSFSIITSPQNQRIESYWSILQRDGIVWWRTFLGEISDLELFSNDDQVLIDCVRYCFMHLIRQD